MLRLKITRLTSDSKKFNFVAWNMSPKDRTGHVLCGMAFESIEQIKASFKEKFGSDSPLAVEGPEPQDLEGVRHANRSN